ncbi:unnamed protein product [Cuscuta campestris]|uniref:Transcription factor IIIC 90kDa subunit N-terminal domain-containing protein n=1 Tax=Cuscuta campestris TaxID=132261 RepID=A0A484M8I0_9ASTE|nr:unnamed protein product [Cuscuta campestris]
MSFGFQTAALVGSPYCANAIAWSEDNLLAVASGHLVTIMNPACPFGARGVVTVPTSKPFQIGLIDKKELISGCLLPTFISRDIRSSVRSISWSPIGFASNASCLLAICTTEGRVKVYRMPFCEFKVEWIEVTDISEMLYTYLGNVNFNVSNVSSEVSDTNCSLNDVAFEEDMPICHFMKAKKKRKLNAFTVVNIKDGVRKGNMSCLSAEEYASRNAMISSLTVAWSPNLKWTSCFSVLAVGGKSGRLSFWRFHKPQCYSTRRSTDSKSASLIGFLQAHGAWITAITWALFDSNSSNPQVMLCTGSSDGSVKLWRACNRELEESSNTNHVSFFLIKEVTMVNFEPVSILSVIVPSDSSGKICLAIGRGSGSIDVWISEMPNNTFKSVGSYNGHDHIVTGLAWAFDGRCLYSCSQDNTLCSWVLRGNLLQQVSIPTNTPGTRSSVDVPTAFDSCCGLAVSPGNLVLAVVHGYDTELLNPMYESRSCKAAVDFLWIGGQHLDVISDPFLDLDSQSFPSSSERELACWDSNILWSLHQYDHHHHHHKPLIMWDIIAALLAFKQLNPKYVQHILSKWLTSIVGGPQCDISNILSKSLSPYLPRIASRTLQLLNIITRQVVLKKVVDDYNALEGEEHRDWWKQLHIDAEKELRDRVVGFNLSVISSCVSNCGGEDTGCGLGHWIPVGLAQMEKWVELNTADMKGHLKLLAEKVKSIKKRSRKGFILETRRTDSICESTADEECSFCTASVPFDTPEYGFCVGEKNNDATVGPRHKLTRCTVSMRVCPPNTPPWHCVCCKRWTSHLAPSALFTLPEYPRDFESLVQQQLHSSSSSSSHDQPVKPLCPFCGILLQRLQPEFLLSPSPI